MNPIPQGYKQTEVGVIPEDWQVIVFGEVLSIRHGKSQKQIESESGLYPILATGGQIGWGNSYLWDKPSVLIGRKGTINKPRYCDEPFWTVDTLFYSEIYNQADAKFTYYKFCMIDWMQYNEASGVPSLNSSTIENVAVAYPQKKEQTAIATALSDVDALITGLESLIAKKQAIKTATMQQLLTGKTRLPPFALREDGTPKGTKPSELGEIPEDWEVVILGDISNLNMGQSPSSGNYNAKGIGLPLIQGNADISNRKTIIRNYTSQITKKANKGDLLISVRAPVGEVAIAEFDCCIGRGVCAIRYPNSYLYHWLINFESQWEKFSKGSTFDSINSDELRTIQLVLPSNEEQTAIATILSDMDAEIQALEQRLGKTRQIKQGMMQELLTGKTRLIKPSKEVIHE